MKEKLTASIMLGIIVLFGFSALGVILFGVQQFKIASQLAGADQVSHLSHILVRQQASLFSALLINNAQSEKLNENLENLVQQRFVLDASLYNAQGKLLAQSAAAEKLRERLGLDKNLQRQIMTQQIVEPIYSDSGIQGFLRVTMDGQYEQSSQGKIDRIFHQLYGGFIVVFLLGALLASSIHYFIGYYRRTNPSAYNLRKTLDLPIKSGSRRFHQRRRRA